MVIECRCDSSFGDAKESLVRLLNVNLEQKETGVGTSWLFSALGFDGAIYEEEVEGAPLNDTWIILNLSTYGTPNGPAFERCVVGDMATFLAGIISRHLKWKCRVLTEERKVICDLS